MREIKNQRNFYPILNKVAFLNHFLYEEHQYFNTKSPNIATAKIWRQEIRHGIETSLFAGRTPI